MSSDSNKKRFFIALLPPQDIQDYANGIKQDFADRFNSRAAQKSPPHITLQPPFEWHLNELPALKQRLETFAQEQTPFGVKLDGFSAFPPRVIFMDVHKTPELLRLQKELTQSLETMFKIIDPQGKSRLFAPHLTVAFRDLTRQAFNAAWQEYKDRPVEFEFWVSQLTLLIHDGQQWGVESHFVFGSGLQT